MSTSKPKIIRDFEKIDESLQAQIISAFPNGFTDQLITYVNKEGTNVSALPYETESFYYLIKMTYNQAASFDNYADFEGSNLIADLKMDSLADELSDDGNLDSDEEDHEDDL